MEQLTETQERKRVKRLGAQIAERMKKELAEYSDTLQIKILERAIFEMKRNQEQQKQQPKIDLLRRLAEETERIQQTYGSVSNNVRIMASYKKMTDKLKTYQK